ncbi:MAG: hypothetical protein AB1349_07660 [Elusimicrobiota bacterium]
MYTGLILGIQILAGYPQMPYYSLIILAVYSIFRCRSFKKIILTLLTILIIGLGISAVQWVPTYEFVRFSSRKAGLEYSQFTRFSYKLDDLVMFVFPFYYGTPAKNNFNKEGTIFWENSFFISKVAILLAVVGIILYFRKSYYVKIFCFLIFFCLIIALHHQLGLSAVFKSLIPGFKYLRIHQRLLFCAGFCIAVLTGYSCELVERKKLSLLYKLMILVLILFELFSFGRDFNPTYNAKKWFSKPETLKFLENDKNDKEVYRIFSIADQRIAFNLANGWNNNLQPYFWFRNFLVPNSNMTFEIDNVEAYTGGLGGAGLSGPENYLAKFRSVTFLEKEPDTDDIKVVLGKESAKLLGLANVKYIVSNYPIDSKYVRLKKEISDGNILPIRIYENSQSLPRVFAQSRKHSHYLAIKRY